MIIAASVSISLVFAQTQNTTISQRVSDLGFHFVGNYTILHETDKSIVMEVKDPTWANLDEWLLVHELGMVTVSKVNQGNDITPDIILSMTKLP
jgi:hypothetical protein